MIINTKSWFMSMKSSLSCRPGTIVEIEKQTAPSSLLQFPRPQNEKLRQETIHPQCSLCPWSAHPDTTQTWNQHQTRTLRPSLYFGKNFFCDPWLSIFLCSKNTVPESQATVIDILAHFISFDSGSPSLAFQWFVPRATLWRHGFLFKGSVHGSIISEVRTVWLLCPTPIFVQHMEAYLPACLCQSAGHLPETLSPQVLGLWPWGKIKKIWPMQKWSFKCLISFFNQSYNAMHVVQQWNSSSCQEAL